MTWVLNGSPFSVQMEALRQAEDRKGFLWLMEQGLGKTSTALNKAAIAFRNNEIDHVIIVCPNSLKGNWQDEDKKWGADIGFQIWHDSKKWTGSHPGHGSIFNYEALLKAGGDVIENLLKSRRCMLILDECHRIKNPSSAITRRILGDYSKHATLKLGLTGTPMTNTAVDLWSQIRFAGGLNGTNPVAFKHRYCIDVPGFKTHKKIVGIKNEEELQNIIAQNGFRATKAEWAKDLPEKLYREPIRVNMPKELKEHYMAMLEEFVVMLDDETAVTAEAVAGQYLKLQQISSGFIYDGNKEARRLISTENLPKFKALMDVIEANGSSSKTLIFSHFRPTCASLIDCIEKETGQKPSCIIGGMSPEETRAQKDAFNSDEGPKVCVLQLSAGKEGHTMLGGPTIPCHTTCYYELNFNLNDRMQSEDRNHRYGQKNPVLYVDFSSSPIESHIIRAYQKKKQLVEYLIDNKACLTQDE